MRLRFMFWLDFNKKEEHALAETILDLKEKRAFAETIRQGIRLICDLRAGRTEVLFELFPWLKEQATPAAPISLEPVLEGFARLQSPVLDGITKLQQQLSTRPLAMASAGANGGVHSAPRPNAPAPHLDDLLAGVEVRKAKSDQVPWMNLTISTAAITGDWETVAASEELWQYGLKHKKIPTSIIAKREELRQKARERHERNKKILGHLRPSGRKQSTEAPPASPPHTDKNTDGPKAMAVPQFEPPSFDDDDLLSLLKKP